MEPQSAGIWHLEMPGGVNGDATVKVLLRGLKHASAAVRTLVADVLAFIPERRTTAALLKRARHEADPDALAAILAALATGDGSPPNSTAADPPSGW